MQLGGYANKVAWIDLTSGTIEYAASTKQMRASTLARRAALGVKYVYDNGHGVDPLSPDNMLCIMNGPLTGTDVNLSGRLAVVTKSPLTGTVDRLAHGRLDRRRLKWAGFDGLVFKGKADKPVYAYVENGNLTLHDACDLWGKNVHETTSDPARSATELHDLRGIAIGPAGENLVTSPTGSM